MSRREGKGKPHDWFTGTVAFASVNDVGTSLYPLSSCSSFSCRICIAWRGGLGKQHALLPITAVYLDVFKRGYLTFLAYLIKEAVHRCFMYGTKKCT